jgi:predicted nucleic acid-binding protein
MFLIDTSAWIFVLGPHPQPELRDRVALLVLENQAITCAPVIFEILRGARTVHEAELLKKRLLSLHVLPFREIDWSSAAAWSARLTRKGISTKSMDLLIAYQAWRNDLTLLHADKDFDRIAKGSNLKVESWVSHLQKKR